MSYDVTSTDNIFNSPSFQISSVLSRLLATVKTIFYVMSFDVNYSFLHDRLEESVIHLPPSVPQWIPSPPRKGLFLSCLCHVMCPGSLFPQACPKRERVCVCVCVCVCVWVCKCAGADCWRSSVRRWREVSWDVRFSFIDDTIIKLCRLTWETTLSPAPVLTLLSKSQRMELLMCPRTLRCTWSREMAQNQMQMSKAVSVHR